MLGRVEDNLLAPHLHIPQRYQHKLVGMPIRALSVRLSLTYLQPSQVKDKSLSLALSRPIFPSCYLQPRAFQHSHCSFSLYADNSMSYLSQGDCGYSAAFMVAGRMNGRTLAAGGC